MKLKELQAFATQFSVHFVKKNDIIYLNDNDKFINATPQHLKDLIYQELKELVLDSDADNIYELISTLLTEEQAYDPLQFVNGKLIEPINYDSMTEKCINTLFGHDEKYFYKFIYEAIGGKSNFKKSLFIKSPKSFGKTYVMEQICEKIFNTSFTKTNLTSPGLIGTLVNKKIALIDEVPTSGLDSDLCQNFKHIIGSKYLSANIKYGKCDMVENTAKIIVDFNNYFYIPDDEGDAVFDRMGVVECVESINTPEFQNIELDVNTIISKAWAMKDIRLENTTNKIDEGKLKIDRIRIFLETGLGRENGQRTLEIAKEQFHDYKSWCCDNGYKSCGKDRYDIRVDYLRREYELSNKS